MDVITYIDLDLTHWGRVTHICVGNLTIIVSDNGLSPGRRQAIICTNAGILLIGPLGTNFSEIQIGIQAFSYKKMHLKMSSVKWRPFWLGLNVLRWTISIKYHTEAFLVTASIGASIYNCIYNFAWDVITHAFNGFHGDFY